MHGRWRDIGPSGGRLVTLAEAREKARHYRKIAREGGDPIAVRRKTQTALPTFAEASQQTSPFQCGAFFILLEMGTGFMNVRDIGGSLFHLVRGG